MLWQIYYYNEKLPQCAGISKSTTKLCKQVDILFAFKSLKQVDSRRSETQTLDILEWKGHVMNVKNAANKSNLKDQHCLFLPQQLSPLSPFLCAGSEDFGFHLDVWCHSHMFCLGFTYITIILLPVGSRETCRRTRCWRLGEDFYQSWRKNHLIIISVRNKCCKVFQFYSSILTGTDATEGKTTQSTVRGPWSRLPVCSWQADFTSLW